MITPLRLKPRTSTELHRCSIALYQCFMVISADLLAERARVQQVCCSCCSCITCNGCVTGAGLSGCLGNYHECFEFAAATSYSTTSAPRRRRTSCLECDSAQSRWVCIA